MSDIDIITDFNKNLNVVSENQNTDSIITSFKEYEQEALESELKQKLFSMMLLHL